MKLPSKEEIQKAVEWAKAQGLVEVRPPPTVTFETLKRRMYDLKSKRKIRA